MATESDQRSRDTFGVSLSVRMRNHNLRKIRPSGAFSPEVTLWNVTRSDQKSRDRFGVPLSVRMCNRKLHNIRPRGTFWLEVPIGVLSKKYASY
jgi:hypothetical protein